MKILKSESITSRQGPATWFTGTVQLEPITNTEAPARLKATRVTFDPGARTAWHTHPLGQALHVVSGLGWVQLKGERAQLLRPGDAVWIEPNELHWHGATAQNPLVHLAIQNADETDTDVVWLEHVTDAEYAATKAL
jgi:quercetin dioxygenase-like cupin family protein